LPRRAPEHVRWSKRDLSAKRYVYFWVDGIHVQARLEDAAQCLLVSLAPRPEGKKELVGLIDGVPKKCGLRPAASAAGCTRPPMC
jgi:hypothetical protein